MEEVEKWCVEHYAGSCRAARYSELRRSAHVLNPGLLDLPFDSEYDENHEILWTEGFDLIAGCKVWVPMAAVVCPDQAGRHNINYSRRGARVVLTSNGNASGFTLAEALVHGTCEYIERHAQRLVEIRLDNPGGFDARKYPTRVEMTNFGDSVGAIVQGLRELNYSVGVWDITSEVRVPTFVAQISRDRRLDRGFATHPNAAVAVEMALVEAVQTIVGLIAGGREDLSVQARSLGRHERPQPLRESARAFWTERFTNAPNAQGTTERDEFVSGDSYAEFCWIRERVIAAGVKHLIAINLSHPDVAPAVAVRVIIPGLESNNPFYTGPRARLALIEDLLNSEVM